MKINETELDTSIVEKINQFEKVKSSPQKSSYLTYENGEFVQKSINELNLAKVFSSDEIYQMSKHLYKSGDNFISAYDTSMTSSDTAYASSALLTSLKGSFAFQLDTTIVKIKTYNTFILALCSNGYMYKIERSNTSVQKKKNILEIITMNFVYQDFDVYSITDFDYYSDGVLFATERNGIFFISLDRDEYSIAIQELYIDHIKVLNDRKTLLITKHADKNNIVLYDLESGNKLSAYNQLGIDYQTAISIDVGENEFYILGKTSSVNQDDDLLHYWKLDSAGVDYVNLDRKIAKNPSDNTYRPKLVKTDASNVYVIGVKEKTLFVWEYSKESLNSTPVELLFNLQDFQYDDIKDFVNLNNKFYIMLDHQILVLDKNFNLLENYALTSKGDSFVSAKITPSGIYAISKKECFVFFIPEKTYQKLTDIYIMKNGEPCNNIDIMIKTPGKNPIIFIDGNSGQKITPYYYIKMDDIFHVVKLINCNASTIIARVNSLNELDKIYGITVHKNRIFYK